MNDLVTFVVKLHVVNIKLAQIFHTFIGCLMKL